jgi:hypothetical protein
MKLFKFIGDMIRSNTGVPYKRGYCIHYQFELTEEYIQILRPEIEIDVM